MSESKVPKEGELQNGELWFSRRGDVLTLGLTSHGISKLGDLESLELPDQDSYISQGDNIFTADGSHGQIEFAAPSRGLVVEVNAKADDLVVVAEDPVEEGWLIRFQVDDLASFIELL